MEENGGLSNLRASTQEGEKELIKSQLSHLDSPLVDVVWCGTSSSQVIVLSEKGSVYTSQDNG
jgi:hypothetical protein